MRYINSRLLAYLLTYLLTYSCERLFSLHVVLVGDVENARQWND